MRLLLCLLTGMLFMLAGCSAMKHPHAAWHAGRDHSRTLVQATVMLSSGKEGELLTVPSEKVLVITQVCGYGQVVLPTGPTGLYAQGGTCKTRLRPGFAVNGGTTVRCHSTVSKGGALPCTIIGLLEPHGRDHDHHDDKTDAPPAR